MIMGDRSGKQRWDLRKIFEPRIMNHEAPIYMLEAAVPNLQIAGKLESYHENDIYLTSSISCKIMIKSCFVQNQGKVEKVSDLWFPLRLLTLNPSLLWCPPITGFVLSSPSTLFEISTRW